MENLETMKPEEARGTKELKEALDLVLTAVDLTSKAMADGKIGLEDLSLVFKLAPAIGPAVGGMKEIPAELSDLSAEEAAELVAHVMAKLSIEDEKARLVVDKGLKAMVCVYDLVKCLKK